MLMRMQAISHPFGSTSGALLPPSAQDLRLIESLAPYGHDVRFFSGNAVRDIEHQRLFDDLDCLRAAILGGEPVDRVDAIIDTLICDMVKHFQIEEAILAAAAYPGTANHAALHRDLLNDAATLVAQFRTRRLGIGELFRFLAADVVVKHALDADRECYPWLRPR